MGIARTLVALITLYEGLILLRAVLSWFVSPYSTHPVVELLRRLTDPVRRRVDPSNYRLEKVIVE